MQVLFRLLFLLLIFICEAARAQDSVRNCNLRISLLTCSPGEELYSSFGHSAFRVIDSASRMDIIFNYGTFDFNDPDFYTKFVRGKLLYFVSTEHFPSFIEAYREENRGIIEQELNLDCKQKEQLFQALRENLREENRFYLYDFLFDNCSTRLRDILEKGSGQTLAIKRIVPSDRPPTFRKLIHGYLKAGRNEWSRFGIDLLLGNKLDRPVQNREAMFLPDYLMKGFDSATLGSKNLVSTKQLILPREPNDDDSFRFTPFIATLLLCISIGSLLFIRQRWTHNFLLWFDRIFFLILGLLGCLLIFMWFGTDHVVCGNNFNLVWAIPLHLPIAFMIGAQKRWIRNYFRIMAAWYFMLFFLWALLPQDMNTAAVPIVILAFIRSYDRFRKIKL